MKLDKAKAQDIRTVVASGTADRAYWHSCTPEERLFAMELMRQRAYGYDEYSVPKFQRVLEIVDLKRYNVQPEYTQDANGLPKKQS